MTVKVIVCENGKINTHTNALQLGNFWPENWDSPVKITMFWLCNLTSIYTEWHRFCFNEFARNRWPNGYTQKCIKVHSVFALTLDTCTYVSAYKQYCHLVTSFNSTVYHWQPAWSAILVVLTNITLTFAIISFSCTILCFSLCSVVWFLFNFIL